MLIKFEIKCSKVRGLCFHNKRPWIILSTANGSIQLWDYYLKILLEKFDEHNGPVRGLDFHKTQPLFVSGGHDKLVKVWNYNKKHSLFTLYCHMDYVTCVKFHHEYPWIASASDDQTIIMWNWQSRSKITVITGHNHYVTAVEFHPTENYFVSSSLDSTIRIWDLSMLWKKTNSEAPSITDLSLNNMDLFSEIYPFASHILEGHVGGVSSVAFDSKHALLASCGDDHIIKLWSVVASPFEVKSFKGHYSNITDIVFHAKKELLLSTSEDKTLRVWDIVKATCVYSFRKESNKFWTIVAHSKLNLFAAGHDNGMFIFKLERERPIYQICEGELYYVKNDCVHRLCIDNCKDCVLFERTTNEKTTIHGLSFNSKRKLLILDIAAGSLEAHFYEIYAIKLDTYKTICKQSLGAAAHWINNDHFAVLEKNSVIIKTYTNETVTRILKQHCLQLFTSLPDTILMKKEEGICLFDLKRNCEFGSIKCHAKFTYWCIKMSLVALVCKHEIYICDVSLKIISYYKDASKIKSGAWSDFGVFMFNTSNHLKYLLINGDYGTIRTLDVIIYISKIRNGNVFCLDREINLRIFKIDTTACDFKLALNCRNFNQIYTLGRKRLLLGQSIISYMREKGYSDLALDFVKDPKIRFSLGVECNRLDVSFEAAKLLNQKPYWTELAKVALWLGRYQLCETCYNFLRSYEKLMFLYLVTGNFNKIATLIKFCKSNLSFQYQAALLVGDVKARIDILRVRQPNLADATAQTHGICSGEPNKNEAKFFQAPPALVQLDNDWPRLQAPLASSLNFQNSEEVLSMRTNGNQSVKEALDPKVLFQEYLGRSNEGLHIEELIQRGHFSTACKYLYDNYGVVKFISYQKHFQNIYIASFVRGYLGNISLNIALPFRSKPSLINNLMKEAYFLITEYKLLLAVDLFREVIQMLTLSAPSCFQEMNEYHQLLRTSSEYILALQIEILRNSISSPQQNKRRICELAIYFANRDLLPCHKLFALKTAMKVCFKLGSYQTARKFAERILKMDKSEDDLVAQKILTACQNFPIDDVELDCDGMVSSPVCGYSFIVVPEGYCRVECPLCETVYVSKYKGMVCNICDVAEIGRDVIQVPKIENC